MQQADVVATGVSTPSSLPIWLEYNTLPILVLCSDASVTTKVAFLNAGAKDCLRIPFTKDELLARLRALRRSTTPRPSFLQQDGIQLNTIQKKAWVNGHYIPMTPREFDLPYYLLSQPNKICHREELLNRVWGKWSNTLETRTIDTHINQLRNKLGFERFRNVHRVGYGYKSPAPKVKEN